MNTTYLIKCVGYQTDEAGNITEIAAEYDPESRGGDPADGLTDRLNTSAPGLESLLSAQK